MEKDEEHSTSNTDLLSQSYTHGMEKISGLTKASRFDFRIPKEIIEERERSWDSLFDKYSVEVSDDIELNIDTLEPEEIVNVQWCSGHRTCVRKPVSMIQYWVDTGKLPYHTIACDNDRSDTGSSLSEKECSTIHNAITEPNKSNEQQEDNGVESSSSVDTAVYILSNTNITKKADTIAIVEGAKSTGTESCKDIPSEDQNPGTLNENNTCVENKDILNKLNANVDTDAVICNSNTCINKNADIRNVHDTNVLYENNAIPMKHNEESDRICDMSTMGESCNIGLANNNVPVSPSTDDNILKENALHTKNLSSNEKEIRNNENINSDTLVVNAQKDNGHSDMDCNSTTHDDYEPEMEEIYCSQKSSTSINESFKPFRRKLFSNRNSPIDLISVTTFNKIDKTNSRLSLHPALESGKTVQRKTHLAKKNRIHFRKRRLQSIFSRESFRCNDSRISANISMKSKGRKSRTNRDSKRLKSPNLSTSQDSSNSDSCCETKDTNATKALERLKESDANGRKKRVSEEGIQEENSKGKELIKQHPVNFTEKHLVVRLERLPQQIVSLYLDKKSSSRGSLPSTQQNRGENVRKDTSPKKAKSRIFSCEIQRIDVDTADSDQSTILICECNDKSHTSCSVRSDMSCSDDSLQDFTSTGEVAEEISKDFSPKSTGIDVSKYINLNPVVVLERLDKSLFENNKTTSKQDLTKSDKNSHKNNRHELKVSPSTNADHGIHRNVRVMLEDVLSSESIIKDEGTRSKANAFATRNSAVSNKMRSHNLFQEEQSISTRRGSKYSFLHLPSSDEEDDITKLIATVRKKSSRISNSMSRRSKTSGDMANTTELKKHVTRKNKMLPINVQEPPIVMSTIITSSEDENNTDQEKQVSRKSKRRARTVQEKTRTSSNEPQSKKNHQRRDSSDQKKIKAGTLHEGTSRSNTMISQENGSISSKESETIMISKASPKRKEQKEPKLIKSPRRFQTRLVDSDFDSDAFDSVLNTKRASLRSSKKIKADIPQEGTIHSNAMILQKNDSTSSKESETIIKSNASPKRKEQKEPKLIKSPRRFQTRLVDSDFDSDAIEPVLNTKRASLRSSKSPEKRTPQKSSPTVDKKIDTSIEFSLKEEKTGKSTNRNTKKMKLRSSVCRTIEFSSSSDPDESPVPAKASHPSPSKKNTIRQDDNKTTTNMSIKNTDLKSEKSGNFMKRTRRSSRHKPSIVSSGENGIVTGNLFHFQSSDDDTEVLYKKSKSISPDERSNYLRINGARQETVNRIGISRQLNDTDNKTTNVTRKRLIFQTKPSYESDSD